MSDPYVLTDRTQCPFCWNIENQRDDDAQASYDHDVAHCRFGFDLGGIPPGHSELTPRYSVSNGARHRLSGMLPRQIKRGEVSDPYWSPCDYSDDWSTNGCE